MRFPPKTPPFSSRALSDWSFSSAATAVDTLPLARASPFLLSLTATGATVTAVAQGYAICPTSAVVTLTYATATCDEFYKRRSAAWPQDCDAKQPLLSSVVTGEAARVRVRCSCAHTSARRAAACRAAGFHVQGRVGHAVRRAHACSCSKPTCCPAAASKTLGLVYFMASAWEASSASGAQQAGERLVV